MVRALRQECQESQSRRQSASLAALALTLLLIVAGLWLVHALRAETGLQDCVMSGRPIC